MFLLPISSVIIAYLDICIYMTFSEKIHRKSRLLAALYSISIHTLIILISNEFLSLFHGIHFISLSVLWTITNLSLLFLFILKVKKEKITLSQIKAFSLFPKRHLRLFQFLFLLFAALRFFYR